MVRERCWWKPRPAPAIALNCGRSNCPDVVTSLLHIIHAPQSPPITDCQGTAVSDNFIAGRSCILVSYLTATPTLPVPHRPTPDCRETKDLTDNIPTYRNILHQHNKRKSPFKVAVIHRLRASLLPHLPSSFFYIHADRGGLRMRHVPRNTEGLLLSLTRRRSGKTTSVLSRERKQLITIPAATLLQSPRIALTGYSPRPSSISSLCSSFPPPPPPTRNIAAAAGKMTMSTSTDAGTGGGSGNKGSKGSSAHDDTDIHFGPFKVTNQVFLRTPHSFALVNLKPLLPGHVLVCPLVPHKRLTDLSSSEITDLFSTVQVVQRMLGRYFFDDGNERTQRRQSLERGNWNDDRKLLQTGGSFNIAVQDGPEAGQTVGHVHVHVIPRIRNVSAKDAETPSDELYEWMAEEKGNVGGALWDRDNGHGNGDGDGGHCHLQHSSTFGQQQQSEDVAAPGQQQQTNGSDVQKKEVEALLEKEEKGMAGLQARPKPGGSFPSIEDAARTARGIEEMEREAAEYRRVLEEMGILSV